MRLTTLAVLVLGLALTASAGQTGGRQIISAGPDFNLPFSPAVRAGGLIYVSGQLATDETGAFAGGDLRAQTRRVLDNIAGILEAGGSDLGMVASATVYLKNAADFGAMNEVWTEYFKSDPPVRTTVITNLIRPDALVEISAIAVPAGGERVAIQVPGWGPAAYSYGIRTGDTLFVAGMISRDNAAGQAVPGDIAVQTRQTFENAAAVLKAGGMGLEDVVRSNVYITDGTTFQDMNATYRTFFPKDPPVRATVICDLMSPDYIIEITLTAVRGRERQVYTIPQPDGSPGTPNPNLSSAVRVGNRLYTSGMLGSTPETRGDMKAQTVETLNRLGRTIRSAGFDWAHVVEGTVWITDVSRYTEMNAGYQEVFKSDFPARATVETGLVSPEGLVEIMFVLER